MGKASFISSPRFILGLITGTFVLIVLLLFSTIFYTAVPVFQISGFGFFIGTTWNYYTHTFGILNFIVGTIILTTLALVLAAPLGIFTALYISEWAPKSLGKLMRTTIELLVGIPSVVFGLFGFYILGPIFAAKVNPLISAVLGFIPFFHVNNEITRSSFFLASVILMIMILPTIVALSLDALRSVPDELEEASYALGADKWDTIRNIILPGASAGIITSLVLGVMRAMGETMAVLMILGQSSHFPGSIFDSGTVLTSKIVNDAADWLVYPESKAALYGIAATLLLMEFVIIIVFRYVSSRFITRM